MAEPRPKFALDLSNDGIALLHRKNGASKWISLGQVSLSDPQLSVQLASLRKNAAAIGGPSFQSEVRIPRSQVFLAKVKLGALEGEAAIAQAARQVEKMTPYKIEEITFDLGPKGRTGKAPIAAVAIETLKEAESFAKGHGFNPVRYTTDCNEKEFSGTPVFYLKPPALAGGYGKWAAAALLAVGLGLGGYFIWSSSGDPEAMLRAPEMAQAPETAPAKAQERAEEQQALLPENGIADAEPPVVETASREEEQVFEPELLAPDPTPTPFSATRAAAPASAEDLLPDLSLLVKPVRPARPAIANNVILARKSPPQMPERVPYQAAPGPVPKPPLAVAAREPDEGAPPETAALAGQSPTGETPVTEEIPEPETRPDAPPDEDSAADSPDQALLVPIVPSTEGTLTNEGILLFKGRPKITPPLRPGVQPLLTLDPLAAPPRPAEQEPEEGPEEGEEAENRAVQPELSNRVVNPDHIGKRPNFRPAGLNADSSPINEETGESTDPKLTGTRPKARPRAVEKRLQDERKKKIEDAIQEDAKLAPTKFAVTQSPNPRNRPKNMAKLIARAKPGETTKSKTLANAPATPTSATVGKEATVRSTFSKRRMSLVGVFGTASARRALVRMPSGRYVTVEKGDRLSGWKVSAIGESSLRINKGSKNEVLRMPK